MSGRAGRRLFAVPIAVLAAASGVWLYSGKAQSAADLTAAEFAELSRAEEMLTRGCMTRNGFSYWTEPVFVPGADRDFPHVVDDTAWARQHGYGSGIRVRMAQVRAADPNQRYLDSLPKARQDAYGLALHGEGPAGPGVTVRLPGGAVQGHSVNGCSAEAGRRLYGDFAAWFRAMTLARAITGAAQGQTENDPRYRAAVAEWARCMSAKGFSYAAPAETRDRFLGAPARSVIPPADEIRTAVAEAGCARGTGLTALAQTLDGQYADGLRRQHQTAVDTYRTLARHALPYARSLLRSQTPAAPAVGLPSKGES
jgi:hypothetical protein